MKKRRKQYRTTTASRNALLDGPSRKRFGKKQKKKLIIISILVVIAALGISYAVNYHKAQVRATEEEAKKGKIIDISADKQEVDDDGNVITTSKTTEIHIIDCGNGNATLVKRGNYEVLIDAGGDVTQYLEKNVSGDIEFLVFTNNFEGCISGAEDIYNNFNVLRTIYTNPNDEVMALIGDRSAEETDNQVIDMGGNLTVTVGKGLNKDKAADRTAIVTIHDNERFFLIAGQASEADVIANLNNQDNEFYLLGGNPSANLVSGKIMRGLKPSTVIVSTKDKLSADFLTACDKQKADVYATYKNKTIIYKITDDNIEPNVDYENAIRLEDEQTEEETEDE